MDGEVTAEWEGRRRALIALAVIVAAYLALGVTYAVKNPERWSRPQSDGVYYEQMTKQLLTRGVYGYKSVEPNAVVTPGYPLFLAAVYGATGHAAGTGGPYALIVALQLLFSAGVIALSYLIGAELLGRKAGLVAAALVAAFPPMLLATLKIVTEPLATLALLGYVYTELLSYRRPQKWLPVAAGVLLAVAVLIRPALLAIGLAAIAYRLWQAREAPQRRAWLASAALVAAGAALMFAPWLGRNAVATGHASLLRGADGAGGPLLAGIDPYYWELGPRYAYAGPSYERYFKADPGVDQTTYARRIVEKRLLTQPLATIEWFTLGKLRGMFARTWSGGERMILTVTWLDQTLLVALGGAGVLLALRGRRLRLPALMLAAGVVSLLPFVPEPRFVYPLMPLLAVFAAAALQAMQRGGGSAADTRPSR